MPRSNEKGTNHNDVTVCSSFKENYLSATNEFLKKTKHCM